MVTHVRVATVVIVIALAARAHAAPQAEITTTATLGTPPALEVKATYSDPVKLFPVLNGTLVFPLWLEVRNVSTSPQMLELPSLQLQLGDTRGTPVVLTPLDAREAQKQLANDVKLNPVLKTILGQPGGPWTSTTYDRDLRGKQLKPRQSDRGYVFFLKPDAFQFNGVMSLGTTSHPPEMLTTGTLTVTRSGGTGWVRWACGLLTSSLKSWCDSLTGAPFGRSYALLFGVSSYDQDAKLPSLPGAASDVKRMNDYLTLQNFDQVAVFTDNEVTPSALRDVQSHFGGKIAPADRLLVYYAGHGLLSTNGGADMVLSHGTRVPITQFMSWIRSVNVKHLLVLLDACYSGAAIGGIRGGVPADVDDATADKMMRVASRGSRFVITAGTNEERAHENLQWWKGGLFTYAVLAALQPPSTKPSLVTTYQMFSTVRDVMFEQERAHGVALQTPLIQDLGYSSEGKTPAPASQGEFVFVRAK
jgi:hypothetical protein